MQNNSDKYGYAGFWVRLFAYMIDLVVAGILLLIVKCVLMIISMFCNTAVLDYELLFTFQIKEILYYLIQVSYFIILTYVTGSTIGKGVLNLKVIHQSPKEQLTFFQILYRETIGRFLSSVCCLGYLCIIPEARKRAFHDILSDTLVVYAKPVKKYVYKEITVPVRKYTTEDSTGTNIEKNKGEQVSKEIRKEE